MKKLFIFFFTVIIFSCVYSQPLPDSIINGYNAAPSPEAKGMYLYNYLSEVVSEQNNMLNKALEISAYFNKQKNEVAVDYTQLYIAGRLNLQGDYNSGLNIALPILAKFEKRKDWFGITKSLNVLSGCYSIARNYDQAIAYEKKRIPIAVAQHEEKWLSDAYNDLGAKYAQASMPDSGIIYAQKAVNIDTKNNDVSNLVFSLSTLAENYMAKGEFDLALPFLRKALSCDPEKISSWGGAYAYLDMTETFLGLKQYDSCNHYAYKAIETSDHEGYKVLLMKSYTALYKSYETTGRADSSNKYFRLATAAKDSMYNAEKTNILQAISFREQLRQQEIETEKIKAEQQRKQNIQFALIALGILTFVILFLALSRRHITNTKIIRFLGVVALLVVFEFLNLLLHPFLERITHHNPILMLLALVCIAALLVPLHHKLEKWATHKLVEKNKAIRLAAAKKTIRLLLDEELEDNS